MRIRLGPALSLFAASLAACSSAPQDPGMLAPRGTVQAGGMTFEYFVDGEGPTCLVVGYPLAVSRALSNRLKERIRFVYLESRLTTAERIVGDVSTMTMQTLVTDIEQARAGLGLNRFCIIGHSISGVLALEYARSFPEHVTGVIMQGTPPFWNARAASVLETFWNSVASPERKAQLAQNWAGVPQASLARLSPSEAVILTYVTNAPRYFHDATYDPTWILRGDYWNTQSMDQLLEVIMADYDLANGPPVQAPVFLAIGRSDYVVPFSLWDTERTKIPRLSYNLFDESGHYPMLEEATRFDDLLLAWMRDNGV